MTDPLAVLQRIRQRPAAPSARAGEKCDMCTEEIQDDHRHVVDLRARSLLCTCTGCYLLFTSEGAGGGHFRAIPDRYVALDGLELTRTQWESFQIPVSIAFFFVNSSLGRVAAFYPGPAGATESELPLDTWAELAAAEPELTSLTPDVEALIVRTFAEQEADCFIVPIDACYELVGNLRRLWRGFDGGADAHRAIDEFFDRARSRSR